MPSGDGSDSEGDLSGGAESSDTEVSMGRFRICLHMEAQKKFRTIKAEACLGISRKYSTGGGERGNIYAVLYGKGKQAGQPESEQRRVWRISQ